MNDSTYPGTTGSSALYTYDHFSQCREHLRPGGVLSCWVPLDLQPESFQIIIRSFQAVMPHSSLWMVNNCLNKHAVLMGTLSPTRVDFQRVKKLVERPDISADLAEINIYSVYELLDCFVVNEKGLLKIGGAGPRNTDDKPALEFGAAIKRNIEQCWLVILGWMSQSHSPVSDNVVEMGQTEQESQQVRAMLEQYFKGTGHALKGLLGILQGDPELMNHEFEMAQKANPLDRDIQSCLDELNLEIKALVAAVERTPSNASLRSRLAKRYLLLRNYEAAGEQYRKFLELEPANAAGWTNLGFCYKELEQLEEATWAFNKAIEYNAELVPAYLNLAEIYERLSNFPASVRNFEMALQLSPEPQRIFIYDRLARSYFMRKEYNLALENVDKALALVPKDSPFYKYLQDRKAIVTRAAEEAQR